MENPFEPPKTDSVVPSSVVVQPMPTTWRGAAWKGIKFGVKAMAVVAGPFLAIAYCAGLAMIIERESRHGTRIPAFSAADFLKAAEMLGVFLYVYGILCFLGAAAGCIIYSLSYASDQMKNKKLRSNGD